MDFMRELTNKCILMKAEKTWCHECDEKNLFFIFLIIKFQIIDCSF